MLCYRKSLVLAIKIGSCVKEGMTDCNLTKFDFALV